MFDNNLEIKRKKWMTNVKKLQSVLRGVYSEKTQLNSTWRRVADSCSQREQLSSINERSDPVDSVCRSWRHKQKHDWLGCMLFN